jgi:hypothetical protein
MQSMASVGTLAVVEVIAKPKENGRSQTDND